MTSIPLTPSEMGGLFRTARQATYEAEQAAILEKICQSLTHSTYRDGEIARLVAGGLVDKSFSGKPTGILQIPPLHVLHWRYSEIDWTFLTEHPTLVPSSRLVYIASVFANAFRRRTSAPVLTNARFNL